MRFFTFIIDLSRFDSIITLSRVTPTRDLFVFAFVWCRTVPYFYPWVKLGPIDIRRNDRRRVKGRLSRLGWVESGEWTHDPEPDVCSWSGESCGARPTTSRFTTSYREKTATGCIGNQKEGGYSSTGRTFAATRRPVSAFQSSRYPSLTSFVWQDFVWVQ